MELVEFSRLHWDFMPALDGDRSAFREAKGHDTA